MSDPKVVIWRNELIPGSETFIVNQMAAMQRWTPIPIGMLRKTSALPIDPALVLFPAGLGGLCQRRIFQRTRRNRRLTAFLADPSIKLVHAHFGADATLVAPSVVRAGIPMVVTFHGFDATSLATDPSGRGKRYRRRLAELFETVEQVLAVSDFIAEKVVGLGAPREKVTVHHTGVPLATAGTTAGPREGILFVGRLVDKKGVADLLRAVSLLPTDLRQTTIVLIGDGPLRPELEAAAATMRLNCQFRGTLSTAEVRHAFERAALFCAPSKTAASGDSEGLPTTVVEAAAHGLPIVSTLHAGIPEAVVQGVTGILVPEADPLALMHALERLLRDTTVAEKMGSAGREHIARGFDIARQTAKLERVYDAVSSQRGTLAAR